LIWDTNTFTETWVKTLSVAADDPSRK